MSDEKMIKQESLILSPYIALYDIIIPKDHELRQLADLVDFSFVDDMLKDMYTLDNGRPGYRPQVMFKYIDGVSRPFKTLFKCVRLMSTSSAASP